MMQRLRHTASSSDDASVQQHFLTERRFASIHMSDDTQIAYFADGMESSKTSASVQGRVEGMECGWQFERSQCAQHPAPGTTGNIRCLLGKLETTNQTQQPIEQSVATLFLHIFIIQGNYHFFLLTEMLESVGVDFWRDPLGVISGIAGCEMESDPNEPSVGVDLPDVLLENWFAVNEKLTEKFMVVATNL